MIESVKFYLKIRDKSDHIRIYLKRNMQLPDKTIASTVDVYLDDHGPLVKKVFYDWFKGSERQHESYVDYWKAIIHPREQNENIEAWRKRSSKDIPVYLIWKIEIYNRINNSWHVEFSEEADFEFPDVASTGIGGIVY